MTEKSIQENDSSDKKGSAEAAFMRAIPRALRNLSRIKPTRGFAGSIPRVPVKTIAKTADKIS